MESLTTKDKALLNSAFQLYELKLYKRGFKVCEQLCKKYPQLAEAIAMKGLFSHCLGEKKVGLDFIKDSIKINLRSHVCWHVYGLVHRNEKNYDEAVKCFRNALKFCPDNIQILRDISVMQIHLRMFSAAIESRTTLLLHRPAQRSLWIGLASAYHLAGNFKMSIGILDAMIEGFSIEVGSKYFNDLNCYKAFILDESGLTKEAISLLDSIEIKNVSLLKMKAEFHAKLSNWKDCINILEDLVEETAVSMEILELLLIAKLSEEPSFDYYTYLISMFQRTKSITVLLLLLLHSEGEQFVSVVRDLLLPLLRKGKFGLFTAIKPFYCCSNSNKIKLFTNILEEELANEVENSNIKLSLALHYSKTGRHADSIELMESDLSNNESNADFLLRYGKILKKTGQLKKAALCLDSARHIDTSDRYLNTKTCIYYLRCGMIEKAKTLCVNFVKKPEKGNEEDVLIDMQSFWYCYEMGKALYEQGSYSESIRYIKMILKFFNDFYQDQYDFHNYVLRNPNLIDYVKTLRYEDDIKKHPYHIKALKMAIKVLLGDHSEGKDLDLRVLVQNMNLHDSAESLNPLLLAENLLHLSRNDAESCGICLKVHQVAKQPLQQARDLQQIYKCLHHIPASLTDYIQNLMSVTVNNTECEAVGESVSVLGNYIETVEEKVKEDGLRIPTPKLNLLLQQKLPLDLVI